MKRKKKQRKPYKRFRQKSVRFGKLSAVILIILGVSWLLVEARKFLRTDSFFRIETISFNYNTLLSHPEVKEILSSNYKLNICGLNLLSLRQKLERIPQVKKVVIRRKFPNIVQIRIEEKEPVCILHWRNSFYGVDKDGCIFSQLKGRFRWDLPVITGLDDENLEVFLDSEQILSKLTLALEVNQSIKQLPLKLSEAHFGPYDELFIYTFSPQLKLRLSKDNLQRGFKNLSLVLNDLGEKGALAASLDLRFKNKVFVHLKG